ncbi:MAG: hypothetical protein FD135_2512 [Comamonadaceae bacterium]|nr:MAG: hypothetical protein FD135_2512 [Comamonadaceae bacterium]
MLGAHCVNGVTVTIEPRLKLKIAMPTPTTLTRPQLCRCRCTGKRDIRGLAQQCQNTLRDLIGLRHHRCAGLLQNLCT